VKKNLGVALMVFPFAVFWAFVLVSGGWEIALAILAFAVGGAIFTAGYKLWSDYP